MKIKNLLFAALAVTVLLISACKRDRTDEPPFIDPTVNDSETVTAGITGIVVNENNIPLSGITVNSSGSNAVTDRYGIFRFKNISISKANASVKVVRNGYFTAYRTFPAVAGRTHNVRIKLIPKTNAGNFSASSGGTVSIAGGGKLVVPAAAVTDASGNAYSGTVNIAMAGISPTATDMGSIIPGDLRGITTGGQERSLETYGMLGVEMTGSGGQVLKIAPGKTAELTFPIPASLQASAPATITLWHFDEATARWKEEGTATKTGANYIANVNHFSFWNCDVPWPQINLCMTLVNPNNQPLGNVQVRIRRVNVPTSSATGVTDSLGNLCGIVPRNEPLVMEVLGSCGSVVYSQNIGPFSANASLGTIIVTIPATSQVIIMGNVVNCSNAPVTNGYVFIYFAGGSYTTASVTNGSFSVTIPNCSGNMLNFSVIPVDNTSQQQGAGTSGSGSNGTINMGTLQACGTSSAVFIDMLIDGVPYSWTNADSVVSFSSTPFPPFSFGSYVNGNRFNAGTSLFTGFNFSYNAPTGNYPIIGCTVTVPGMSSQQIITASPQVTLTEIGAINTGFLAGNYSIVMQFFPGPVNRNVNCSFRARRN
jgi:hypothetical protein